MTTPRVAIVHDWLDTWRGGENVLAEIVRAYPQADLFALVDFLPEAQRARLLGKHAHTTFIATLSWCPPPFPHAAAALSACDRVARRVGVRPRAVELARRGERGPHVAASNFTSATATRRCATRGTCATSISRHAGSRPAYAARSSTGSSTGCATGTGAAARGSRSSSPIRNSCASGSRAAMTGRPPSSIRRSIPNSSRRPRECRRPATTISPHRAGCPTSEWISLPPRSAPCPSDGWSSPATARRRHACAPPRAATSNSSARFRANGCATCCAVRAPSCSPPKRISASCRSKRRPAGRRSSPTAGRRARDGARSRGGPPTGLFFDVQTAGGHRGRGPSLRASDAGASIRATAARTHCTSPSPRFVAEYTAFVEQAWSTFGRGGR